MGPMLILWPALKLEKLSSSLSEMTFHVGVRATNREESRNVRLRVVDIMGRENHNLLEKNLKADT
jgi:hypothetical protein